MSELATIFIDRKEIKAKVGSNLLSVALENGFDIPNLCHQKDLTPTGACRLCIVKIEGMGGLVTSCSTTVSDGMKVTAFDEELEETRKATLEMMLSDHNDDCINCTKDGICELQDLAFRYELGRSERSLESLVPKTEYFSDFTSSFLNYDASKCIKCERCVKACYELQGKGVLSLSERGIKTHIIAGQENWKDSECDGCGQCLQSCPTGALSLKTEAFGARIREKDIEKKTLTTCPYCGVGCKVEVSTIKNKVVKVEGADEVPNYTKTCVKGRFGLTFAQSPDRIKKPLIKKNGKFEEVEWDEALEYTAKRLSEIKAKYGSDALYGITSARCTNEDNFALMKFMRTIIGTNNVDHCARVCHAPTVAGLNISFGSGAMTNSIAELEHTDLLFIIGSNTTEAHPVIATFIKRAKLLGKAKIIVIDPRKIEMVKYADIWLRQNPGTDVALINGIMNFIFSENLHNEEFIKTRTEGFEEFKKVVDKYTPEYAAEITGVPAEKIKEVARMYATAKNASIVYTLGITEHSHGVDNVTSLGNLSMITGQIGRESTGVNPLRGQNNVQGACDMGALPNVYVGYQKVDDPQVQAKFEKAWNTKLSAKPGVTKVESLEEILKGNIKAMYIMGENTMVSDPNINYVRKSLENIEFLVMQDIFHTDTTPFADVILPASSFLEKEGTFTSTERRVNPVFRVLDPIEGTKADWLIVQEVAKKMGYDWNYGSAWDILSEINSLAPIFAGITPERIKNGERLQWPCPSEDHPGTKFLHKGTFTRGRGYLKPIEYRASLELPCKDYPLILGTGRMLYHYHTTTMTGRSHVINSFAKGLYGPCIEMNAEDMKNLNIENGDKVKVSSRRGEVVTTAIESDRIIKGHSFMTMHFPEAPCNLVTNDVLDPISKTPEYKVCSCKVEKVKSEEIKKQEACKCMKK
ncbi:MAG: formate dehydrogenase subunit alpha [bacterium]